MPQSIPKGLTREHVLKALADLDAGIGHSFGIPTRYEFVYEGKRYAPKAVIGIAFRHLAGEILLPAKFSGGEAPGQANYELRRLGFTVEAKESKAAEELTDVLWSNEEINLLVADYFDLLQLDLLGRDYSNAERDSVLRKQLNNRSDACVQLGRRRLSAALVKLGLPYIDGYKPARENPLAVVDAVQAYLDANPWIYGVLDQSVETTPDAPPRPDAWDRIFVTPPEDAPVPDEQREPWRFRRRRVIDFVRRDARNHRLGRLGEQFTIDLERRRLLSVGRDDLARKVEWVSDTQGDGLGFDVLSFDERDDSEKYIEVKTTRQGKYFPFLVSSNEVRCSQAMARQYCLYRVFRFVQEPRLYVLHGSLSDRCRLEPVAYRATVSARHGTRET